MVFFLSSKAQAEGYRFEVYDVLDSTNIEALERAKKEDPGKLWILAKKQLQGRGRYGRVWDSAGEGNLTATLLLVFPSFFPFFSALSFVTGLALVRTLLSLEQKFSTPEERKGSKKKFQLKWPNDILSNGEKLSGVLVESVSLKNGKFAVAIGIGVNIVSFPDSLPYPACCLHSLGIPCCPSSLFLELADQWIKANALWNHGKGALKVRDLWLSYAPKKGSKVTLCLDNERKEGFFETINEEYQAVIRLKEGDIRTISSGDLRFSKILF